MPAIPYKQTEGYEPRAVLDAVLARRGARGLVNLDRMLLHSAPLAEGWNVYLGKIRGDLSLNVKLRELAICVVAVLNEADYELVAHAPIWQGEGGTPAQLGALPGLAQAPPDPALFDFDEQAVIELTRDMTRDVKVRPQTLAAAKAALGNDRELVELIAVIAAYNMVSRFLVATGVDPEG